MKRSNCVNRDILLTERSHHFFCTLTVFLGFCVHTYSVSVCLPGNLTLVNIHTSLAEETSSPLRLLATVQTEEVEVRRLTGYLKVANSTVTL